MSYESICRKGQNEVISFIHNFFKKFPNTTKLHLFSDNCSSQNKNKVILQYLSAVVNSQSFNIKRIIHQYPEPGHSFLSCYRYFGHTEKARRKLETVYLPTRYEKLGKILITNFMSFMSHKI